MRSTVLADCLRSVTLNFDALQDQCDLSLKNCTNSELKARILGVKVYTKTFSFIFGIHLVTTILAHTDNMNKTLQSTKIYSPRRNTSVNTTKKSFKLFLANWKRFAIDHNCDEPKDKKNKILFLQYWKHFRGPSQYSRVTEVLYCTLFDTVILCIHDRFI